MRPLAASGRREGRWSRRPAYKPRELANRTAMAETASAAAAARNMISVRSRNMVCEIEVNVVGRLRKDSIESAPLNEEISGFYTLFQMRVCARQHGCHAAWRRDPARV